MDENKNNFAIKDGDFLKVYSITDSMNGAILLSGHAEQPGFYPWQEGMLLKEVISSYQDLLPMTDLNYVLVKRKNDNDGFFTFFQIDIEKTLSKDNKDSFELLDQDELLFFPSLLSPELISTELIEEKYEVRDQQFDTSLTYLATSLDREKFITTIEYEEQQMEGQLSNADDLVATPTKSFYQYNIYDLSLIHI